MNRRKLIEMTDGEREGFLEGTKTISVASIDNHGWPHIVAMWFCLIDGRVHMTTFKKAQKAVNLRRDPRVTFLAESGATYAELRGVMVRGEATLVDDTEFCAEVLLRVQRRGYFGDVGEGPEVRDALRAQASKRVVIRIEPRRVSSWDHSKLGGGY
ncbi:MAG: pyridoxamine 5'-phosphate oxidase family protein [Candidatus Binatia bacterium]